MPSFHDDFMTGESSNFNNMMSHYNQANFGAAYRQQQQQIANNNQQQQQLIMQQAQQQSPMQQVQPHTAVAAAVINGSHWYGYSPRPIPATPALHPQHQPNAHTHTIPSQFFNHADMLSGWSYSAHYSPYLQYQHQQLHHHLQPQTQHLQSNSAQQCAHRSLIDELNDTHSSSEQNMQQHSSPEQTIQQHLSPQQNIQQHSPPQQICPQHVSPQQSMQQHSPPQQLCAQHSSSQQNMQDHSPPQQICSHHSSPQESIQQNSPSQQRYQQHSSPQESMQQNSPSQQHYQQHSSPQQEISPTQQQCQQHSSPQHHVHCGQRVSLIKQIPEYSQQSFENSYRQQILQHWNMKHENGGMPILNPHSSISLRINNINDNINNSGDSSLSGSNSTLSPNNPNAMYDMDLSCTSGNINLPSTSATISSTSREIPSMSSTSREMSAIPSTSREMSAIPSTSRESPSTSRRQPYTRVTHGRRSPYEWMKRPSYQSQPKPGKTRTKDKYRVVYTDYQRLELEKEFHLSQYITIKRKAELALQLNLTERQVKIWFQNRRAKQRKQMKKQEEQRAREQLRQQTTTQMIAASNIVDATAGGMASYAGGEISDMLGGLMQANGGIGGGGSSSSSMTMPMPVPIPQAAQLLPAMPAWIATSSSTSSSAQSSQSAGPPQPLAQPSLPQSASQPRTGSLSASLHPPL